MSVKQKFKPAGIGVPLFRLALIIIAFAGNANSTLEAAGLTKFDFRSTAATRKFSDTLQHAAVFHLSSPDWARANRFEFAIGAITHPDNTSPFVSLGPVWHWDHANRFTFAEFGFSPTLVEGTTFGEVDLGGHFHFTSSLSIGLKFGRSNETELALRAQHTSNGGLNSTNPGIDMVGLNYKIYFSNL